MTQQTTIFGVLGTEPEQVKTRNGAPMVSFRLAHNHRFFSQESNEWVQGSTSWFTVSAYRNLAQNILGHLSKGDRVFVVGRLQVREFDREDGSRGKDVAIIAESAGPDLRFVRSRQEQMSEQEPRNWGSFPAAGLREGESVSEGGAPGGPEPAEQAAAQPARPLAESVLAGEPPF